MEKCCKIVDDLQLRKLGDNFFQDLFSQCVSLKGYGNIFLFGLSIRTFGVIAISVVNFLEACSVSEILKDKRH